MYPATKPVTCAALCFSMTSWSLSRFSGFTRVLATVPYISSLLPSVYPPEHRAVSSNAQALRRGRDVLVQTEQVVGIEPSLELGEPLELRVGVRGASVAERGVVLADPSDRPTHVMEMQLRER